jgi:hypothetical protein
MGMRMSADNATDCSVNSRNSSAALGRTSCLLMAGSSSGSPS